MFLLQCFASAAKRPNSIELTEFFALLAVIVFLPIVGIDGAWYLIGIIIACNVLRFFMRGAWYYTSKHQTSHPVNPCDDSAAFALSTITVCAPVILFILRLPELFDPHLAFKLEWARCLIWYGITVASVMDTIRRLGHTAHKYDWFMLYSTKGHIGIPNWISIWRIAISLVLPHIWLTQSFERQSNMIATILLLFTVSSDALDGAIARRTGLVTKLGKYLDPLADKVFFLANVAAFIQIRHQDFLATGNDRMLIITLAFAGIALLRDLMFIVWYVARGRKIREGIGASFTDKLRQGAICAWFLSTAISLSIPISQTRVSMVKTSIWMIVAVALLSIISIYVDYERAKAKAQEGGRLKKARQLN